MNKFHLSHKGLLGSVALAFSLFFTLGSAATQAQNGSEFAGGNGTEKNPWQIATKQQLAAVDNYKGEAGKGKYFILTQDLDFTDDFSRSGAFYNDGTFWKPLCSEPGFQGTFDGGNHEIIGLRVNFRANSEYSGLFEYINYATIKNLTVSYGKVEMKGNNNTFGGIASRTSSSVIKDCHVTSDEYYGITIPCGGGLIGMNGGDTRVIGSSFVGELKLVNGGYIPTWSNYTAVLGGIVGGSYSLITIEDSFVEGEISNEVSSGFNNSIGGLIGTGIADIYNCYVKANISVSQKSRDSNAGGFIGNCYPDSGYYGYVPVTIEKSYFQGNITGNIIGGLIGKCSMYFARSPAISIICSYADGKFQGMYKAGGLIGYLSRPGYGDSHGSGSHYINQSYSKGEIEVINDEDHQAGNEEVMAGGFIGHVDSECDVFNGVYNVYVFIVDCYSHCNVKVSSMHSVSAGGLVGSLGHKNNSTYGIEIQNSYAMGAIEADQGPESLVYGVRNAYLGGLIAAPKLQYDNSVDYTFASVKKSVAMNPSLTAPHGSIDDMGRIGVFDSSVLSNNYALKTMTIKIDGKDVSVTGTASDKNGLAKTASELAQQSTYTGLGWNFNKIWKMSVNGYPILDWEKDAPLPTAPSITSQPKSQTVNVGSSVTFSVTATGTEPLNYQWYKGASPISGATGSSYTISSVTTSDAGNYFVIVTNSVGSAASNEATLTVNVPVTLSSITINGSSSVNVGSTATYTCTATYSNGTTKTVTPTWSISSGASYASITSAGVLTGKAAGTATVKATYEGKTATKNVTVNAVKPTITTQPKSQTVNEGNSVTFSVVATGTAPLSYQWYKDGKAISGATGSSYTISSAKSSDAGSYYVIVSNTAGSVTSSTVTLTVILKPVITVQPRSLVVDEDDPATFSVVATGTAPLSYQWYKDGRAISGATGSSYTISSAKKSDEGSYYVIVRNNAGSVTSNTVTLTVNKLEPDGTAIRSISINGLTATVTLTVVPNKAVNVYFIEENIPAIGTIIPNDGGVYTASKNVIRWSFLDNASRVVSYTVTVPSYLDNVAYVNGTVTFDTNVRVIDGDNALDFTLKTHPADTNENFEITTPEVSLYAVAWKLGQSWSREPADIPMSYVSRAALIWVNGGDYIYDASKAKPFCWVDATARAAAEEEPSVSTTERTVSMDEGKANVSIEIVPAEGISVYLVEEQLSADVTLNVTNISDGGNYIAAKNVIRWSFLDGAARTLTYTLEPEEGFVGTIALTGEVMFDEETFTIEGDTEANFGTEPTISYVVEDGGKTLVLSFVGTLYESEDTVNWTEVEGAQSPFIVDTTKGKKFYRCAQ